MKKFLFTLAVLLMAGSMYAEDYLYIEDFEVPASVMAETSNKKRSMEVYVKASFESYVSAMMVTFTAPEGATVYDVTVGEDYPLTYNDKNDNEVTFTPSFGYNSETCVGIAAVLLEEGFYYPEGTDPDEDDPVSYGNPKWIGQYDKWLKVTIRFAADFTGGELMVKSEPSCTPDPRGNVCPAGQENYHACNITVEGTTPVDPELPGMIVIGEPANDGSFYVTYLTGDYEGEYTMTVTINGEVVDTEIEGTYQAVEGENHVVVTISAAGYQDKVAEKTFNYHYPTYAPDPTFIWNPETLTMEAVCEGHTVILYMNGTEVSNPYTVEQTDEEQTINFSAMTVAADEDNNSVLVYYLVVVPAKEDVEYTAVPVVTYEVTEDAYIFTATGDGEVKLYVDGVEVENPYTVARPETAPEEPYAVYVYATAQEEGKEMSQSDVMRVEIAAKENVDPHMNGYWLVAYTLDGQERWFEFIYDKGNYTMILPLDYETFGGFDYENGEARPNINFNIVIDGVMYGAADDETIADLGNALLNPLFEGDNEYVLEEGLGHIYNMGLFIDPETGEVYVYAAIAGYTDVNEVNAAKTVAGVRYYNMAGQEMQEANGMTIVVTTYTDGTTSAVKVMK